MFEILVWIYVRRINNTLGLIMSKMVVFLYLLKTLRSMFLKMCEIFIRIFSKGVNNTLELIMMVKKMGVYFF